MADPATKCCAVGFHTRLENWRVVVELILMMWRAEQGVVFKTRRKMREKSNKEHIGAVLILEQVNVEQQRTH